MEKESIVVDVTERGKFARKYLDPNSSAYPAQPTITTHDAIDISPYIQEIGMQQD